MLLNLSQDAYFDKESLSQLSPSTFDTLKHVLSEEFENCMLIPITRPDNHQLSLVVALIDKQDEGIAFDSFDLQAVHQCFQ